MGVVWRLITFLGLVQAFKVASRFVMRHWIGVLPEGELDATATVRLAGVQFAAYLLAAWIMSKLERKSMGSYGLPLRRRAWLRYAEGLLYGFASVSLVVLVMKACGVFEFDAMAVPGVAAWRWSAWWWLAFLAVALLEEYQFRGYLLRTLQDGVGFWPAALLLSALFAWVHHGNAGETAAGLAGLFLLGIVLCWTVRRTGCAWTRNRATSTIAKAVW